MSDIKIQPSATGSATVTLTAPVTNTARTITFPDSTSTLLASDGSGANLTGILTGITDNSNATAITIDASENVGIGTASPTQKLHVAGNIYTTGYLNTAGSGTAGGVQFADGNLYMYRDTNDLAFKLQGSERLRIDSSGNVGIGVTPESDIDSNRPHLRIGSMGSISATSDSTGDQMYISNNCRQISTSNAGGWKYINTDTSSQYQQMGGYHEFRVAPSGTADAAITWTTAMTIDASGNTYFGGSSLTDGTAEIRGSGASAGKMAIRRTSGSNKQMIGFYNGSTFVGEVNTNTSSTTYSTSSDYRLKENVNYTWDATTRLKQLKPARFNFKANDSLTLDGFLAHEVSDIVPEAITGTKDALDSDSNPVYQGIDQSKLVPLLVKTIQELEARLTAGGL
jgi:hypothetical protein